MKMKIKKLKKLTFVAILNLVFVCIFLPISFATNKISTSKITPYNDPWIKDSDIDDPLKWDFLIESDSSIPDVQGQVTGGQADLKTIGESYQKIVSLNSTTHDDWKAFNKTDLVIEPDDGYGIGPNGAWCSHSWNEGTGGEQPKNTPRMHWRYNVSLPVDMSDYKITSASLTAEINATVNLNVDTPGDTDFLNQWEIYDWAQFYIEVSNLEVEEVNTYKIAFNQTEMLGNDALSKSTIDGFIEAKTEQAIIDALTNVLATDSGHNNFTLIIGIYMYCEDNNSGTDNDNWDELRFKSVDLTFTYEKKIDKGTKITLKYIGNSIIGENITITRANLQFQYKIDQEWISESEFSELRIYINNNKFEDSIRLSDYDSPNVFVDAVGDGFELPGHMIPLNENISLSIQLYLANEFNLESNITISIDKVKLHLYWQQFTPDVLTPIEKLLKEPWFATLLAILVTTGLVSLGIGFVYYYRVGRFPLAVRKVRKYRKSLNRKDPPKGIRIIDRNSAFKHQFSDQTKVITRDLKDRSLGKKIKQTVLLGEFNKFIKASKGDESTK